MAINKIILRQFQEKDLHAVFDLHVAGLKQVESLIVDPSAVESLDKDLNNIFKEYIGNNGEFLVADMQNQIIAIGGLRKIDQMTAEIKRMRVDQNFQGQGIGRLLLNELIEIAKKLGYKKLILDTSVKQIPAQRLYVSCGFKETKRGEMYGQATIYYEMLLT